MKILCKDYQGRLSNFIKAYEMILIESKNYQISDELVKDIVNKIDNKFFSYTSDELKCFDTALKDLSLTVIVSNSKDIKSFLKNHNITKFDKDKIKVIEHELQHNYAMVEDTDDKSKFMFINENAIDKEILPRILRHELTHFIEDRTRIWYDLLPKDSTKIENNEIYQILSIICLKLNMNYSQLYYITSGKEFEAFCTSVEDCKNEINKENVNNFLKFMFTPEFDNLSSQLKTCCIFMFFNLILDKKKDRIQYLKEHLV